MSNVQTADQALDQVFDHIRDGASPRPVDPAALDTLRDMLHGIFSLRIEGGTWEQDHAELCRVADHLGAFANLYASIGRKEVIETDEIIKAAQVVSMECKAGMRARVARVQERAARMNRAVVMRSYCDGVFSK